MASNASDDEILIEERETTQSPIAQKDEATQPPEKKSMLKMLRSSMTDILKPPISRWTTLATSMRYMCSFASDYYLPLFYFTNYPNKKT